MFIPFDLSFVLKTEESHVFPGDSSVVNVKNYGAIGDGINDDTAAIQAAINAFPNSNRILYFPNGIYLVNNTLVGSNFSGSTRQKRIRYFGQSQSGVVIKLRDFCPGYESAIIPKAVINTGFAPAQRFRNGVSNLTIDTGMGNPAAIGLQFNASNQGSVENVTIRSGDDRGVAGLDMRYTDEIGPLLIKSLTVIGFDRGIWCGAFVNSQTLENITIVNPRRYGISNGGQSLAIRKLKVSITNKNAIGLYMTNGHVVLLDSSFESPHTTTSAIVNVNNSTLFARNINVRGFNAAIRAQSKTVIGTYVDEFNSTTSSSLFDDPATVKTINLPIKETPEIPWEQDLSKWVKPQSFGATGGDTTDDKAAIQAAIDSSVESGATTLYFPTGAGSLRIDNSTGPVFVRGNISRITGCESGINCTVPYAPALVVTNDLIPPVVVIERLEAANIGIDNASTNKTLVCRNLKDVTLDFTGQGDCFVEDVVGSYFRFRQNVWCRQLNVENQGLHVLNDGGNVWILGYKTERGGVLISTINSGKTELYGTFAYTTTNDTDGTQNSPMFLIDNSQASIIFAETKYNSSILNYPVYIREIRGSETRDILRTSLPPHFGSGKRIPFFSNKI